MQMKVRAWTLASKALDLRPWQQVFRHPLKEQQHGNKPFKGEVLTLITPYARSAHNDGALVGVFGIAITTLANGASGAFTRLRGVFRSRQSPTSSRRVPKIWGQHQQTHDRHRQQRLGGCPRSQDQRADHYHRAAGRGCTLMSTPFAAILEARSASTCFGHVG